ncbi:collagen-like protein [Emticicia sp. BO119]|uniref:collagen-like triple helix repeat-containing protein n=1 Tax=Emticicia sp. BO119 TaxID=2757768 RepID=UPI0015F08F26|nr:collagen-like protein [Emticicia sp. BO119]MBA4853886.1 collagen-like protein [Emticicia sp. BO119]
MKKTIYYPFILSIIVLLTIACEGPAGEQGPIGPQGDKGDTGAKGVAGSAKLYATNWIAVTKQDHVNHYVKNGLYTGTDFTGTEIDKISQKVIDDGVILAYVRKSADKSKIMALPYFVDYGATGENLQQTYYFAPSSKKIACYIEYSKSVADISKYLQDEEYRFIIIPGPSGFRLKNIDLTNYEAVKDYFNLND